MDPSTRGAQVAYLGPEGTFTEQALRQLHPDTHAWPAPTVAAAFDAVRSGVVESAVLPFENSVEGSVSATLDEMIRGGGVQIVREAHVEVEFSLLVKGEDDAPLRRIATHPHAAAQTRGWIEQHYPRAEVIPESSTARAAELVAQGVYDAAIANALAGRRHGLRTVAEHLADRAGAITRFVEITTPMAPPAATGADTTSLVAYIRQNRPGALLELLEQFAARGIDLSRLESRPTGSALGQYCFAIDAIGHLAEPRMAEAIGGLRRTCADVVFLGSYPRADGAVQPVPAEAEGDAFTEASAWVTGLLSGRR